MCIQFGGRVDGALPLFFSADSHVACRWACNKQSHFIVIFGDCVCICNWDISIKALLYVQAKAGWVESFQDLIWVSK